MAESLRCDADGCDHIEGVDLITEAHVGKPCPKCGASLFTQEDWETWQPIQALLLAVSKVSGSETADDKVAVGAHVHGSKMTIFVDTTGTAEVTVEERARQIFEASGQAFSWQESMEFPAYAEIREQCRDLARAELVREKTRKSS